MTNSYKIGNLYNLDHSVAMIMDKIESRSRYLIYEFQSKKFTHMTFQEFESKDLKNRHEHNYFANNGVKVIKIKEGSVDMETGYISSKYTDYEGKEVFRVVLDTTAETQEFFRGEIIQNKVDHNLGVGKVVEVTTPDARFRQQGKIVDIITGYNLFTGTSKPEYRLETLCGNYLGIYTRDHLQVLPEPIVKASKPICNHNKKYKNVVSANLKFWYCPDCGKDLGDV